MTRPLANRQPEVQLFQQITRRQVSERILLIEAPSKFGKSELLGHFAHVCDKEILLIRIDLRAAQTGIAYVFWRAREVVGHHHFPAFTTAVTNILRTTQVNIAHNVLIGQTEIQIALSGDEQTRQFRLMALFESFMKDLRAIERPMVILFDTFEAAGDELKNWLGGAFLAAVVDTPQLITVIAGQSTPPHTIEWRECCYETCHLPTIDDVEAWHTFVQAAHWPFSRDVVKTIVTLYGGVPLDIQTAFDTLRRGWQA